MKKIILTAIGLAMFATPLAAQSPQVSNFELHRTIERHAPLAHPQATAPQRFLVAPAGSHSFGLTLGTNRAGSHIARPGSHRSFNRHGVPYSTPPQGWGNPR